MLVKMSTVKSTTDLPRVPHPTAFFGHPGGLANLAGVEMWERFSFYGMQAILAFYLYYSVTDGGLGMEQSAALSIVGAYGGLVYLSAILGAWVADRLFGAERTLTGGASLIMVGHIALAVLPGFVGVGVGLVCVALGSGTLKATSSSVLGDMYSVTDERRDGGFSIYYMGVNLGALLGPLITGALWGWRGFHWDSVRLPLSWPSGWCSTCCCAVRRLETSARRRPTPCRASTECGTSALRPLLCC